MNVVFIKLLNMSITAGWLALAVILLRFLLKKAPKWIMGVLWGLVAIRLICPFSPESIFSLIPSAEPIPQNIILSEYPAINSGLPILNQTINPFLSESLAPNAGDSVNPMQIIVSAASVIWLTGIFAMLLYTLISYVRIRRKISEAVPLKENIWVCDRISTPFILGIIRPRICLPSSVNGKDMIYVISHEKAHLKRKDHIWKPLGFLLLSVYWFNPVLWVAYILLCRDIELACDEKVIRRFGTEIKKPYSDALINCSVPRKMISACPLAFGEAGVKERVKSVLNYKKPAFWVVLAAVAACVITAVCLLTDPAEIRINQINEGPDFGNLFSNIQEVTVIGSENNYTTDDEKAIAEKVGLLQDIRIKSRPISQSRAEDRDKTHRITINGDNTLCFSENYSELWIDTGVKPTLSYKVVNPSKAKNIFETGAKVGGADEPDKIIINPDVKPGTNHCFNAEVLEVSEGIILVKPDSDSKEIKSSDRIYVSLDVTSTVPVPAIKVGDRVQIIYNGEIAETYPAQINNAFVIYLLGDDGKVLSPTPLTK